MTPDPDVAAAQHLPECHWVGGDDPCSCDVSAPSATPVTVGALRAALRGISDDAWIVVQEPDGHWTPTRVEHLPIGGAPGQVVLSDADADTGDVDDAHDWLIRFVEAYDPSVVRHYFHMCDGQHKTCGCKWEGNDDPR